MTTQNIYNREEITHYLAGFAGGDARMAGYLDLALNRALCKHEPNLRPVVALTPDAPGWMRTKWEAGERDFMMFGPDSRLDDQVRHVADWIRAAMVNREPWLDDQDTKGRPRRLLEIGSLATALTKADKAMRRGANGPALEDRDGDVGTAMELPDGFRIVELLAPRALVRESQMLGHCIGKGAYDEKLGDGHRYYSLRDARHQAHATFEVVTATNTLKQCKGKQNQPPVAKYRPYVRAFVERERFRLQERAAQTGLVQAADGRYHDLEHLPEGLSVSGYLNLSDCTGLTALPKGLSVGGALNLRYCTGLTALPEGLSVGNNLYCRYCIGLTTLPENLVVGGDLDLSGSAGLINLPKGLSVGRNLDLAFCTGITELPNGLSVKGDLELTGCTGLTALPEGLSVGNHLFLAGCTDLRALPKGLAVGDTLNLASCTGLTALPDDISVGGALNLRYCTGLTALPAHLSVNGNLDLTGCTGLRSLPKNLVVRGKIIGFVPSQANVSLPRHAGRIEHQARPEIRPPF